MYPELITRPDLKVFLPPIGGISVYVFGNPAYISGNFFSIHVLIYYIIFYLFTYTYICVYIYRYF